MKSVQGREAERVGAAHQRRASISPASIMRLAAPNTFALDAHADDTAIAGPFQPAAAPQVGPQPKMNCAWCRIQNSPAARRCRGSRRAVGKLRLHDAGCAGADEYTHPPAAPACRGCRRDRVCKGHPVAGQVPPGGYCGNRISRDFQAGVVHIDASHCLPDMRIDLHGLEVAAFQTAVLRDQTGPRWRRRLCRCNWSR